MAPEALPLAKVTVVPVGVELAVPPVGVGVVVTGGVEVVPPVGVVYVGGV
jgi:hypothetical protein